MATLFNARQICEKALRKIGAMSINDTAAQPEHLDEALEWLDIIMAELGGTGRCWWLVPNTLLIPLTGGTATYALPTALGSSYPSDGIQFPLKASLNDGNGNHSPINIVRRNVFEELATPGRTGRPQLLYITREREPSLTMWPVLGAGVTGFTIDLVVQTFSPDVVTPNGNIDADLDAAWQRWAIYQLSADLADGSIRRVPAAESEAYERKAETARTRLMAFQNREHHDHRLVVTYRDM